MIDVTRHTEDLLRRFRRDLPATCKTAAAIDRDAPWTEISQCAEEEGLHSLAAALFEAEQLRFEGEAEPAEGAEIARTTEDYLHALRKTLPQDSKTAAAIDRHAPWTEIAQNAEEEGLHEIAGALFEAEKQRVGTETSP